MLRKRTAGGAASGAGTALLYRPLVVAAASLPLLVAVVTAAATAAAAAASAAPSPPLHGDGVVRHLQACGITGGCATLGTCDDSGYEGDCAAPDSLVCESQLPGLNICESPPTSTMLPCWMSEIDGSLRLNQISLPGTHNTMAKGISACLQEGRGNPIHTQVGLSGTERERGDIHPGATNARRERERERRERTRGERRCFVHSGWYVNI